MGPKSAIAVDDIVFWMGVDTFYVYSGQTQQMACPIKSFVFGDFDFELNRARAFPAGRRRQSEAVHRHAIRDENNPALVQLDVYSCKELDETVVFDYVYKFQPVRMSYRYFDRENNFKLIKLKK